MPNIPKFLLLKCDVSHFSLTYLIINQVTLGFRLVENYRANPNVYLQKLVD